MPAGNLQTPGRLMIVVFSLTVLVVGLTPGVPAEDQSRRVRGARKNRGDFVLNCDMIATEASSHYRLSVTKSLSECPSNWNWTVTFTTNLSNVYPFTKLLKKFLP
jgi:hypothetical protein